MIVQEVWLMSTAEENYEKGNVELLTMFENNCFDKQAAERILAGIRDIDQPILGLHGYSTTYLYEAQNTNNVDAVRFLFEHGADPNLNLSELTCDCAFHYLQLPLEKFEEDLSGRLKIAKLFLEYGADPNLLYEGETLYDDVQWAVFNDSFLPHDREYINQFFKLLVAYGGGGGNSRYDNPVLSEPIDKNRIDEYTFKLFLCEDRYHLEGHLFNPEGIDIGIV